MCLPGTQPAIGKTSGTKQKNKIKSEISSISVRYIYEAKNDLLNQMPHPLKL